MLTVLILLPILLVVNLVLSGPISNDVTLYRRNSPKYVVAHFIVGNVPGYTAENWLSDIRLAHKNGIDGFALNVGVNYWEPQQVAIAYKAAEQSKTGFKLFLSFDMTSLPCTDAGHATTLRNYITPYASHPNQLIYNDRVFVSTFAGQQCQFGQGSVVAGWQTQFVQQLTGKNAIFFVPSFFVDPATFNDYKGLIDGAYNWNGGWPLDLTSQIVTNYSSVHLTSLENDIGATTTDEQYIRGLNTIDGAYMAAVAPWFFTHYSKQTYNKNFVYDCDEWLWPRRWMNLVRIREQVAVAQIITWNDYGESHYVGPIEGTQPNSQAWVDGFDHTGWLSMVPYFAAAFKTGQYPAVTKDHIVMWSRPHPAHATAADPVGPPTNYQLAQDKIWAVVFAAKPATLTLRTSSAESRTFNVGTGVSLHSLPISAGGSMTAMLKRNGKTVIDLHPQGFTFNGRPSAYNFNAFVVSS